LAYAKRLRKIIVPSNDIAGFIGNGHFMRDALYGMQEAERMASDFGGYVNSVYAINKVTQDMLIRPMGIFQLIDYVGVEVCSYIMSVMNPKLDNEDLHSTLLDTMISQGITGGQYSSGAQKDGFLKRLSDAGFNTKDLGEYLYAKHAQERNEYIYEKNEKENGSGITDESAIDVLNGFEGSGIEEFANEFREKVINQTIEL